MRAMTITVSQPSGPSGVRSVLVSLAAVDFLVADQPTKYAFPLSVPAPDNGADMPGGVQRDRTVGRPAGPRKGRGLSHDDRALITRWAKRAV